MNKCDLKIWRRAIIICVFLPGLINLGCKTVQNKPAKKTTASINAERDPNLAERSNQAESGLPSPEQLIKAKLTALEDKQAEQERALAEIELKMAEEQQKGHKLFDDAAYLSLSMTNTAPKSEYRLEHTEIYVDGKLFAEGGKRNQGLPRKREFYSGPIAPGCHDIVVQTRSIRLKNDLISRFKVDREVIQTARQTIVAKAGHRIDLHIEGYEAHNTFANFYRGPALRFNRLVRPNVLPELTPLSLEGIFNAGRVYVDYVTDNTTTHRLIEKSVSIDGMPVLVKEKHNSHNEKDIIFDAPLSEGKHTLSISLIFAEKKWIKGSPLYNLRLNFDRDFYVISGQTTLINLTGIPRDSFHGSRENARYARAKSQIVPTNDDEFFPNLSCREIADQARAREAATKNKTKANRAGE